MAAGINRLTDKRLRALLSSTREREESIADGDGLGIRISRSGVISWVFSFRIGGRESKLERIKLGNYPELSIKLAREKRDNCRSWLAEGKNPRHQLSISQMETLKPVTVLEALEYWLREYAIEHRKSYAKDLQKLQKHIYPNIGSYPLAQCETRHWLECFDRVKKKAPVQAGYILQMCKQALRFCRLRRYAISSALDDLTINLVAKRPEKGDREHTEDEISDIWKAANSKRFTPYYAALLKLLVVFGCRTGEARLSRWDEWDLTHWVWTVPKEHSKGKNKIIRPVPEELRTFIKELQKRNKSSGLLLGEMKKAEAVSNWGITLARRLGHSEPWTLHDLRRTFSTSLNNLGVAPHVVEQLLGHTMPGVMSVYNKSQYLPEKLAALDMWCERLGVLAGNHENISILRIAK